MSENIYVGNAKTRETQYGGITQVLFTAEDLDAMRGALENGFVRIDLLTRKEVSAKGYTHYGKVSTWKPEKQDGEAPKAAVATKPRSAPIEEELTIDDVPF